jgi:GNAT superfamily N-acetyltransferase
MQGTVFLWSSRHQDVKDMTNDFIDVRVWTDLIAAAPAELAGSIDRAGGAVATRVPAIESLLINRVFSAEQASPSQLETLCAGYPALGISKYFVHADEASLGQDSRDKLAELGLEPFHRRYIELRRGREAITPVATDLTVREATADDGEQVGVLFCSCFGMPESGAQLWPTLIGRPGWHAVVAVDGATVAGAGFLFVSEGEGYLAGGATAPSHRRRGVQGALMSWRLQRGLDAGCQSIWTETGEKVVGDPNHSYNNMLRHGFEPVSTRLNFVPAGTRW